MIFFLLKNSDIDDCAMNPCSHGTCQDESNDFTCTCETGWEGKKCDKGLIIFFLFLWTPRKKVKRQFTETNRNLYS